MASNTVASKSMEPVLDFAAVSTLSLYKGIWRALYIFITCREKWRGWDLDLISHTRTHTHSVMSVHEHTDCTSAHTERPPTVPESLWWQRKEDPSRACLSSLAAEHTHTQGDMMQMPQWVTLTTLLSVHIGRLQRGKGCIQFLVRDEDESKRQRLFPGVFKTF